MRYHVQLFCFFLCLIFVASRTCASTREDNETWRACDANAECTSIEIGCWYWSPVNKKYMKEMKAARFIACRKSMEAGPQPASSCHANMCVNDPYTVAYWPKLTGATQSRNMVEKRTKECLGAAGMEPPAPYSDMTPNHFMVFPYNDLITFFFQNVDNQIRHQTYPAGMPLDQVMESAIVCDDVVAKAKSLTK